MASKDVIVVCAAASAKSIVLSPSWYVAVIPVSVLLENIAPVVSEINSASVVPSTVIASASRVPSMSTSPEISNDVPIICCVNVTLPSEAIAMESESEVCPMFAPLIIILSTVNVVNVPSEVIFVCAAVVTVAAVPLVLPVTLPVISPTNAVDVILVAPVTTPASITIAPSRTIC